MKRRTQDDWRALIAEQKSSGQSASEFCQARGINAKYFSIVKSKLKTKISGNTRFQSLGILRGSQSITLMHQGIDIHIPLAVDVDWLAAFTKRLGQ